MNIEPTEPTKSIKEKEEAPKIVTLQVPETAPLTQKKTTPTKKVKAESKAAPQPKIKVLEINDLADLEVFNPLECEIKSL